MPALSRLGSAGLLGLRAQRRQRRSAKNSPAAQRSEQQDGGRREQQNRQRRRERETRRRAEKIKAQPPARQGREQGAGEGGNGAEKKILRGGDGQDLPLRGAEGAQQNAFGDALAAAAGDRAGEHHPTGQAGEQRR